ncbi:MAG TPA: aspartyl protease family protein [Candidatus Baltobacteraceae bacterium]|jgi:predicted aspartyl protease
MIAAFLLASALDRGAAAYKAGDFEAAQAAYAQAVTDDPKSAAARLGLGRLELYRNDFDAAERDLDVAAIDPATAADARRYLDQVKMRRAAFAPGPYDAAIGTRTLRIPFAQRDPLPVIAVAVNGKPAHFVIDTGAPDLIVDPAFAKAVGATLVADGVGTFAGGRQAAVSRTTLATFAIGGVDFPDVPAAALPTGRLQFGGTTRIDGIVGTGFLLHFLATLDYADSQLILAPRGSAPDLGGTTAVPMWFVGDHFLFARGALNDVPMLFLVDTGLAGGGLNATSETLKSAGIVPDTAHASQGVGGGGPVTAIPFVAARVALGDAVRTDVRGIYTPEGSPLAMFPFAVGGAVSHGFFSPGKLTFDFRGMRLIVTP